MQAFIENIVKTLDSDLITSCADAFKFLGFNKQDTFNEMKRIEGNENILFKDVTTIVTMGTVRGTNFLGEKFYTKMSPEGAKQFQDIVTKYGLKASSKGTEPNVLSIGRIMASMPVVTLKVRDVLIAGNALSAVGTLGDMDLRYAFPGGAALPVMAKDEKLFEQWVKWSISFSKTIKSQQTEEEVVSFANMLRSGAGD